MRGRANEPELDAAKAALDANRPTQALRHAREVLRHRPDHPAACLIAGLAAEELQQDDLAAPWLRLALRSDFGSVPWVALARIARRAGDLRAELDKHLEVIKLEPDSEQGHASADRITSITAQLGDPAEQALWLNKARRSAPRLAALSHASAKLHASRGDLDTALELLESWLAEPEYADANLLMLAAEVLYARDAPGDTIKANRLLELVIYRDKLPAARLKRAAQALSRGEIEAADGWLEPALTSGAAPTALALHLAGRIAMAKSNRGEAATHWYRAATLPDVSAELFIDLARLALSQGRLEDASLAIYEADKRSAGAAPVPSALRDRLSLMRGEPIAPLHGLEEDVDSLLLHAAISGPDDPLESLRWLSEARESAPGTPGIIDGIETALSALTPDWRLPDDSSWYEPAAVSALLESIIKGATAEPQRLASLEALNNARLRLDEPLDVAILGEFSAGKSTLINALLGEQLLATGVLPTTAQVYSLRHGARPAARRRRDDGSIQELSWQEARELAKGQAESVAALEIIHPNPLLRELTIWDTPGFNAPVDDHEEQATAALERAEAVVWVLSANQALNSSEFERMSSISRSDERLLIVLNKVDIVGWDAATLAELEGHLMSYLDDSIASVHYLSARETLAWRLEGEPPSTAPHIGPWRSFEAQLRDQLAAKTTRLKTLSALNTLSEWAQTQLTAVKSERAAAAPLYTALETHIDSLDSRLDDHERELSVRLAGLRSEHLETIRQLAAELKRGHNDPRSLLTFLKLQSQLELSQDALHVLRGRMMDATRQRRQRMLNELSDSHSLEEAALISAIEGSARCAGPEVRSILREHLQRWRDRRSAAIQALRSIAINEPLRLLELRWDIANEKVGMRLKQAALRHPLKDEDLADLQSLLPVSESSERLALESWGREYYAAQRRFCAQLKRDLELVDLRLERRWQTPLRGLVEKLNFLLKPEQPELELVD